MAPNYGNNPYEIEMTTLSFNSRLELLLQQTRSIVRSHISSEMYRGKAARMVNQIGVLSYKQPQGRGSPIVPEIANYTGRWVFPNDRSLAVQVDQYDELRTIVDPKGGLTQACSAGANRYFDDLIINAANASATTGPDPGNYSTESFASTVSTSGGYLVADTFGASASTGMTWPKIVEMTRVFRHAQVDMEAERPCLIMGSQQEANLSLQQEVISREYGVAMIQNDGIVTRIGKFDVIVTDRLNSSASTTLRNCLAFVPSGLHLGIWRDTSVKINNRFDLEGQPWQLYSMITAGATRTQLFKVGQINAADTSGFDQTAP